ncbi:MAG: class I SAM-dependent methyltransferase [Deltaproteobacteria bacterium]|nr:class I SAM-dependent methyltransferase [Deltaproteobacteria bacterium]
MTDFFNARYLKEQYDHMAESYMESRSLFDNTDQLEKLAELIPPKSTVLDLGCGTGLPVAKFFTERDNGVTGIDLSDKMIRFAKENVPNAVFYTENIINADLSENSFDLIVSFYCLFHLRKEQQREIFNKIMHWLKSGGYAYFTLATKEYTGQEDFEGTIHFENNILPYSHYSLAEYPKIFQDIGATLVSMKKHTIAGETMLWVLLKKPDSPKS